MVDRRSSGKDEALTTLLAGYYIILGSLESASAEEFVNLDKDDRNHKGDGACDDDVTDSDRSNMEKTLERTKDG